MLTAIIARPSPQWMDHAACRNQDPAVFFPGDGGTVYPRLEEAQQVCGGCPVRSDCLSDAITTGETGYGIRAGLTPDQLTRFAAQHRTQCRAPGCTRHAAGTGEHPSYCTGACYTRARRVQQARSQAQRRPAS